MTAMTLQALAPYYGSYSDEIDTALELLSSRQSDNGDFQSYGTYNAESTAQVVIALSALGVDCDSDEAFIKNGNSVIDGLLSYKLSNGGFEHSSGGGFNNSAVSQALNAFVAYARFADKKGSFYSFENKFEFDESLISKTAQPTTETTSTAVTATMSDEKETAKAIEITEKATEGVTSSAYDVTSASDNEIITEVTKSTSQVVTELSDETESAVFSGEEPTESTTAVFETTEVNTEQVIDFRIEYPDGKRSG